MACLLSFAISAYDLRCELLSQPCGIDNTTPRLGWKLSTPHNGARQTAYQIMAASRPELLSEGNADLWDSGKVPSAQSQWVAYQGKQLASRSVVYWQVRVWDENDKPSDWAKGAKFTVGILDKGLWQGRYIGMPRDNRQVQPMLHRTFQCKEAGKEAYLHVSTLGYHEVYVNGSKVGDDVLAPAVVEFTKRHQSMTYEIGNMLREGRNDIVIWLGGGWYDGKAPGVRPGGPYVMAQIDQCDDGEWQTLVCTDASWHARPSGYYNNGTTAEGRFGGEVVRAAELLPDLDAETLDKAQWSQVSVLEGVDNEITPMMCEPNRIMLQVQPQSIRRFSDDVWMVDMGRSIVGWTSIRMGHLKEGQNVTISYCDMLGLNGDFEYGVFSDQYVASGKGEETFCNKFNYHAYRYMKIKGLGKQPALSDIAGYGISTGYQTESAFVCNDDDINAIHDMVHYTLRCLTQSGYMVDCPHLERQGYGGDGNASILAAQIQYDMYPLYRNWLQAYGDAQGEDGRVPHVAPTPWPCGGGPFWCAFIANAPWRTYQQYGDERILQRYYPNMKRYLQYARQYMPDGLLRLENRWPSSRLGHWYLGDWALPNEEHQLHTESIDDVNSCSMSMVLGIMEKVAEVLGEDEDRKEYGRQRDSINQLIHQTFYVKHDATYANGLQLDMAFPLLVDATPEKLVPKVGKSLRETTYGRFDGHMFTGLVGVPILTQWLTKSGDSQLMYDMLKQRGFPGYLYMIENGASTTWEHWNARRSRIHNCYNGIGSWFYEALAGIVADERQPGYRHFHVRPQMADGISFVRCLKPTPYGNITVDWKLNASTFDITVEVPAGTTATVECPASLKAVKAAMPPTGLIRYGLVYSENDREKRADAPAREYDPTQPIELQSGKYRLVYTLARPSGKMANRHAWIETIPKKKEKKAILTWTPNQK